MPTFRRAVLRQPPRGVAASLLLCLTVFGALVTFRLWKEAAVADAQLQPGDEAHRAQAQDAAQPRLPSRKRSRQRRITEAMRQRCEGTLGDWCVNYYAQEEVPAVTAPRGMKTCNLDCNKVGTCSALDGMCACPAGWHGFNCLHPLKRYCAHTYRAWGFVPYTSEANLTLGMERESIWAFPASHCAGYCDEDFAGCFCPSNTKYGRVPPPVDAPLGSPPVRQGRPMGRFCQPNKMPDGRETTWGTVDPEDLYGPQGWCTAEKPNTTCGCIQDGWGGPTCDTPHEQFCFNQCNGRGECQQGFCKCDPGWHGIDCAHRSQTASADTPGREVERPWIADLVHTPAAIEFPQGATRKRPLIFVYELPSHLSTLMLQWRLAADDTCVPRRFGIDNSSLTSRFLYSMEPGFLEMLLQSEHRTLNPEEADFFYVPVLTSCFMNGVRNKADHLYDFFYSVMQNRAHAATNMLLEAYHWISSVYPYWDRRGGRDHIWLLTHDEASCYAPKVIRNSIILTFWGRTDANHTALTAQLQDQYSTDLRHPQFEPDGFLKKLDLQQPCYDPVKDLVVPNMKPPDFFHQSPLLGAPTRNRTWLAFHRGRAEMENLKYSRGIRQRLVNASQAGNWLEKYKIVVGGYNDVQGDYSELLASSVFCLVLPGDGYSARMDDATVHGCIPVIIMDNTDVSLESVVDLSAFTLRIPQQDAEKLPEILEAIPQNRREQMQRAMAKVWQRFIYSSYRLHATQVRKLQRLHAKQRAEEQQLQLSRDKKRQRQRQLLSLPDTVPELDPLADDAFATIMAWLHSRIEATR